jgi:O-antigen/teichoic acid export membrane protein
MSHTSTPTSGTSGDRSGSGDMLFGMGSKLLYAASRVALPPLALAHMGLDDYGLWSACFVLVSYVGMAASGFSLVYLRHSARHYRAGDIDAISRLLSTGILTMALAALLLLGALALAMPSLLTLFRVPEAQQALASQLWLGAVAVFLADMSLGAFAHLLHATGRLRLEQKVWVAAFALEALLIVGLLQLGLGVQALLLAFAGRYLFSALCNAWLAWTGLPGLRLSLRLFDPSLLKSFFIYGAGMQASGLIATALQSADRLLAGSLMGPAAAALMDLAGKLPVSASSVSASVAGVAVSATARHDAGGDRAGIAQVYRAATRLTVASLALIMPFLALFAPLLVLAWLGPQGARAEVALLMPWLVLAHHAHLLTGPATALARGQGRLNMDFGYHGLRAALMLVSLLFLLGRDATPSLLDLALALCLGQIAAAAVFIAQAQQLLLGSRRGLLRDLALPTLGAYGAAAVLAVLLAECWPAQFAAAALLDESAGRLPALAAASAALLLWLALAGVLLWAGLLSPAERQGLLRRLPLARFRRAA